MMGVPVRYRILSGEAKFTSISAQNGVVFPDGQSITVTTDKDAVLAGATQARFGREKYRAHVAGLVRSDWQNTLTSN